MKTKIQNRNLAHHTVRFPTTGQVKGDAEGVFEVHVDDARAFHASPGFSLAPGETLPEKTEAAPVRRPARAAGGEGGGKGRRASRAAAQEPEKADDEGDDSDSDDGEGDGDDADAASTPQAPALPPGEPSMAWTEEQMRTWLRAHDVEPDPDWTKPRLLAAVTEAQE